MDLEELARYWARFHISFSWDYPDGFDLQAVQKAVFHVVSETDASSQEQLVVGCVQSAGAGVILTRPRPETDVVPCEMSFTAHPMSDEFSIKSVVIVSEARNVELYVDGSYVKTAKGIMLTIRKGSHGLEGSLTLESLRKLWKDELLKDVRNEVKVAVIQLKEEMNLFRKKIDEIEASQKFLASQYDKVLSNLQGTNRSVQDMNANIQHVTQDLIETKEWLDELDSRLDEQQQYGRRDCLEFVGIPKVDNDDPVKLVIETAALAGVEVKEDDISIAHRLKPTKKGQDRIIAKFIRRSKRDEVYSNRKNLKQKRTKDLPTVRDQPAESGEYHLIQMTFILLLHKKTYFYYFLFIQKRNLAWKVSLLETEFDLSEYVHSKCKCLVKFLSFPNAHALRLQTIVVKIAKTPPAGPAAIPQDIIPGTIDFASVKDYINSSGKELTPEAQKLLASMEQMQMAQALSTQAVQMRHPRPRSSSVDARRKGLQEQEGEHSRTSVASDGLLHQAMIKAREMEEEEMINRMDHRSSPDESDGLVNMLAGLMNSKGNHDIPSIPNGHHTSNEDSDPQALAQARWEAYLQSRVRAGQSITDNSRPGSYAFSTSTPSLLTSLQGPPSVIDHAALDNTRDHSHPLILNGTGKTNKVNSAPELHGANTRCAACGCPGCIAVYNSIATNIYAAEERIMARVDEKMQQILQHIDARFEKLGQSTLQRQEQFPSPGGYSGPGNHRRSKPSKSVGDTSGRNRGNRVMG
ncbi:predicted protein [Nematostella vectensis]|uniref:Uncharacterized protein n=1 Tax=Nematostella vectensis TaxID=45351 RepID=A7S0Q3_NEMVE|nr:predicted protein [Nematostella vectensis]|eukprot:XP_001634841.1 predicted protein [Nematostella vectensis]